MQRELRDHQQRAADVVERAVHLPGVVVEDAQADDLAAEEIGLGRRVARRDAEQHAETVADGADHLAVDRHPGFAHPLHHRPHARGLKHDHQQGASGCICGARVAPPSSVG